MKNTCDKVEAFTLCFASTYFFSSITLVSSNFMQVNVPLIGERRVSTDAENERRRERNKRIDWCLASMLMLKLLLPFALSRVTGAGESEKSNFTARERESETETSGANQVKRLFKRTTRRSPASLVFCIFASVHCSLLFLSSFFFFLSSGATSSPPPPSKNRSKKYFFSLVTHH